MTKTSPRGTANLRDRQPFFFSATLPEKTRDLAFVLENFETFEDVLKRRERACAVLWKGELDHHMLAHKLRWLCGRGERCGSPACPVCTRRFRRWLYGEICSVFSLQKDLYTATLVPLKYRYPSGELHRLSLVGIKDLLRQQINRVGLGHLVAVGGVDMSFNEHADNIWPPHWQAHFHIAIQGARDEDFGDRVDRFYPADKVCLRPIVVDPVRNAEKQLSYLAKPYFARRVSFITSAGVRNARDYPLKDYQLREITLFLSKSDMMDRIFLFNCRRYGSSVNRRP